ncbi:hypothetical protein F5Y16DRAFT_394798 [Xylariaceae sp. FL0255]|nr:hypothetical protein F5Y16DRAFT_394798 [Xylariaceae sp. FL0255]
MRLLNNGTLKLEEFVEPATAPPYAILSHTWGEGEITFQHLQHYVQESQHDFRLRASMNSRPGFRKIQSCIQQSLRDGLTSSWLNRLMVRWADGSGTFVYILKRSAFMDMTVCEIASYSDRTNAIDSGQDDGCTG